MFLSDSLVWALSSELVNVSGVKVFCDSKDRNDSMNCFIELFKQNWTQAIAEAEEQYDDVEADVDAVPIRTELTEYGFFIDVDPLDIKYDYGDYYDLELGRTALEQSLLGTKDKFSSINYEGHIAFPVSDVHCGGIAGWEVAPKYAKIKKDKTYDFVGEKLGKVLNEVVNETEESDFWAELSSWFENEWDIEETIEVLFAYSQWIEKNTFERIIERIVEIAEEIDEDSIDEYNELIDKLSAGEKIVDKKFANLPDGYMEALDMFMMAEELGAPQIKTGKVMSSEGTFEIVIAKAEEGNAEAKFIAGKYFIADHIDEERDRAIRWIKEASEAGVEEATEYIKNNSDLF